MMGNIINKARIKQRSLVITLLDLKNAFGEVHHNLISSVPTYHHVPDNIKSLISGLYTNFKHLLSQIITDRQLSLSAGESCKVIASALYFLTCASTLSFSS